MSGQETDGTPPTTRRRKSKWDIPAETDKPSGSISNTEQQSSVAADATQRARERAAQLAAKLAKEGKLASGARPPPILVPGPNQRLPGLNANKNTPSDPEIIKLDSGGYVAEFEINDLPARVNLTKKAVQEKISQQSGAAIATKGRYLTAEEKNHISTSDDRPLYLSIQAPIQAKVQVSVHMIKEIVRNFGKPDSGKLFNGSQSSSLSYIQDKVFVGLETVSPEFNVKLRLEGPQGAFLQHIITQTNAKVHLRGKGSGYIEPSSGRESFEPLHLYLSHPNQEGLNHAKSLCESLLQSVHNDLKTWSNSSKPYSQQGYNQPMSSSYGQQSISYPSYNEPPPNHISAPRGMTTPGPPMQPPGFPQAPPPGHAPPTYYPPPGFPQQPTLSYPPHYQDARPPAYPSYPQDVTTGYQQHPPLPEQPSHFRNQPPSHAQAHVHQQVESEKSIDQKSDRLSSSSAQSQSRPEKKRRRFTEAPELIRKSMKADDRTESHSHSLDSNTTFRSTGEESRDKAREHPSADAIDKRDRPVGSPPRVRVGTPPSSSSSNKNKRKEDAEGFKAPVLPLSVVMKMKKKKQSTQKSQAKNPLLSLISYGEDSDSDDD